MPPKLAACIFTVFILLALRRYTRKWGAMSRGLWVPFIYIAISMSRPIGYWFVDGTTAASASAGEGSFIDRNAYLILIITGLFVLARRGLNWGTVMRENRWLFLFYFYLLFSTLWSPVTFISFKRWFKDFGDVVMVLIIITENEPVEALRAILMRCIYLLVPLSVLFMKYFPALGRYNHRWTWDFGYCGITLSKNELGLLVMLGGLFVVWQMVDVEDIWEAYRKEGIKTAVMKVWPDLIVLCMCLWVMSVAECATAEACGIIGLMVFFGMRLRFMRQNMGWLGFCGVAIGLFMLAFSVSSNFRGIVAGVLGRDATLTDRTLIWEAAMGLHVNPLLGAGFSSVWLTKEALIMLDREGMQGLSHAHNGYLETYLNCGLIGVGLLGAILVSALRNSVRLLLSGAKYGPFFFALVVVGLFYNYTEVTFYRCNVIGLLLWLFSTNFDSFFCSGEKASQLTDSGYELPDRDIDFDEPEALEGAKNVLRNRPAPSGGGA